MLGSLDPQRNHIQEEKMPSHSLFKTQQLLRLPLPDDGVPFYSLRLGPG